MRISYREMPTCRRPRWKGLKGLMRDRRGRRRGLYRVCTRKKNLYSEYVGLLKAVANAILDTGLTAELSTIYTNIQKILDLRHKYLRLSLQRPTDNPKDDPS